jgi:hypothetical protein
MNTTTKNQVRLKSKFRKETKEKNKMITKFITKILFLFNNNSSNKNN